MARIINVGDGVVDAVEGKRDGYAVIRLRHPEVIRVGIRSAFGRTKPPGVAVCAYAQHTPKATAVSSAFIRLEGLP